MPANFLRNLTHGNPELLLGLGIASWCYIRGERKLGTYLKLGASTLLPTALDYMFGNDNWERTIYQGVGEYLGVDESASQHVQDEQRRRIQFGLDSIHPTICNSLRLGMVYDVSDTFCHDELHLPRLHDILPERAREVGSVGGGIGDVIGYAMTAELDLLSIALSLYDVHCFNPDARTISSFGQCLNERKATLVTENVLEGYFGRIFPSALFRTGDEIRRKAEQYVEEERVAA